jgi:hypothetical protein
MAQEFSGACMGPACLKEEGEIMLTITDVQEEKETYWKVEDTSGKMGGIYHYNVKDPLNTSRTHVIETLVSFFDISGFKNTRWKKDGEILYMDDRSTENQDRS